MNSTIANNTQQTLAGGTSSGSAIHSVAGTPFTLENTTIAGNSGGKSLEGSSAAAFTMTNTIVSNAAGGNCSTAFNSAGHNLETADECGLHSAGDKVNTNPLLGTLTDNGGPTDTVALLAGSAAIDAADGAVCPAADQRGVARVGSCDIGAFEFVPTPASSPDTTAPTLSQYAMSPTSFAAAPGKGASIARKKKRKTGSNVSFSLSEAATVQFSVERKVKGRKKGKKCVVRRKHGKRCTAVKTLTGSFSRAGTAGKNTIKFTGRLNGKRLKPGSYNLVATPTDAAHNKGKAQRKAFKIKR